MAPINLIVYDPKTEEGQIELAKRVSDVHAAAVTQRIKSLNCPTSQKLALLEADVNFKVVKEFVSAVTEKAVGEQVLESLVPAQQIVKIVHEELIAIMGEKNEKLLVNPKPPTVIMMVGLQGSGKTTHTGKLAKMLKKQGKRPLLVACDVYRPAAIKQLQVVGESVGVPVFSIENEKDPVKIASESLKAAQRGANDVVLIDTAGRLHNNQNLMNELAKIRRVLERELPDAAIDSYLVLDATTGQNALIQAKKFNEVANLSGIILTKLDGTAKGGIVISIADEMNLPIKYIGVGEQIDDLIDFDPEGFVNALFE